MRLHTSIGPAEASLSAVAEEAGVRRLTLYRHFPTRDELFAACMGHWRAIHAPPDVDAWRATHGLLLRARRALQELYEWYEQNGDDLGVVGHDDGGTSAATRPAPKVVATPTAPSPASACAVNRSTARPRTRRSTARSR